MDSNLVSLTLAVPISLIAHWESGVSKVIHPERWGPRKLKSSTIVYRDRLFYCSSVLSSLQQNPFFYFELVERSLWRKVYR